jgi:hypothetical protein
MNSDNEDSVLNTNAVFSAISSYSPRFSPPVSALLPLVSPGPSVGEKKEKLYSQHDAHELFEVIRNALHIAFKDVPFATIAEDKADSGIDNNPDLVVLRVRVLLCFPWCFFDCVFLLYLECITAFLG